MDSTKKYYKVEQHIDRDPIEINADTYDVEGGNLILRRLSDAPEAEYVSYRAATYEFAAYFPAGTWISLIAVYPTPAGE